MTEAASGILCLVFHWHRVIVFCESHSPLNAMTFLEKALDRFYFDRNFKIIYPLTEFTEEFSFWTSIMVPCRVWDPLVLFVSTPNGPSLLHFEVFCWHYGSSALILMLWVSASSSTTPSLFPVGCISSVVGWETRSLSLLKLCLK